MWVVWICPFLFLHAHLIPFSSSPYHSCTAISQILNWVNLFPFSGPLHILFLVPRMLFPQLLICLTLMPSLGFSSTVPSSEVFTHPHSLIWVIAPLVIIPRLTVLFLPQLSTICDCTHNSAFTCFRFLYPSILCDTCVLNHSPILGKILSGFCFASQV